MFDLIWVGNTLYPRWFVIAVAVGGILLIVCLVTWIDYMMGDL